MNNPLSQQYRNPCTCTVNTVSIDLSKITLTPPLIKINPYLSPIIDLLLENINPYINFTSRNRNQRNQHSQNNRSGWVNFNGRYKSCGFFNHHAKDCFFLRKF